MPTDTPGRLRIRIVFDEDEMIGPGKADLLDGIATGIDDLDSLRYNPLALVYLDANPPKEGFGYQVGYGEDLHTLGVSWNASMFGRDGVHTVFLGGMHEPELVERSDEYLGEVAGEEFERAVGAESSVIDVASQKPGCSENSKNGN